MYRFSLGGLRCECDTFGELLAAIYVGVRHNGQTGQVSQEVVAWLSDLKASGADGGDLAGRTVAAGAPASRANKSVAIRDYRVAHGEASPKEIAEALARDGIKVSAQFVSTVLSNAKRKGGSRSRRREAAAVA